VPIFRLFFLFGMNKLARFMMMTLLTKKPEKQSPNDIGKRGGAIGKGKPTSGE
jgi:hypothetical protein